MARTILLFVGLGLAALSLALVSGTEKLLVVPVFYFLAALLRGMGILALDPDSDRTYLAGAAAGIMLLLVALIAADAVYLWREAGVAALVTLWQSGRAEFVLILILFGGASAFGVCMGHALGRHFVWDRSAT